MELTGYLGQKILEYASVKGGHVVAWGTQCKTIYIDKSYMTATRKRLIQNRYYMMLMRLPEVQQVLTSAHWTQMC